MDDSHRHGVLHRSIAHGQSAGVPPDEDTTKARPGAEEHGRGHVDADDGSAEAGQAERYHPGSDTDFQYRSGAGGQAGIQL
jgi:hypothetical protein